MTTAATCPSRVHAKKSTLPVGSGGADSLGTRPHSRRSIRGRGGQTGESMSSRAPTAWVPFISEEIGTVLANVAQRFPRSRSRRKPKLAGKARDHVARAAQQSHLRGFFSHHVERKTSQPAVDRNTPATGPPPVSAVSYTH